MKSGSLGALLTLVALAAVGASCGPGSARAPSAADAPHPSGPSRTCDGCHPAIAAEWSASFHRTAFVDETFQRSLALEEPREHAFCTRCHAPGAERAGAGVAVGVDCVDCHGASPHEPPRHGAAASAVKAASSASPFAEVACPQCHMPAKDGHQDHRFLSGHAPDRLGAAVHVEVARHGADALDVAIRVDAGHAFPTGDMFRRARLLVFAEGARGEIVQSAERIFGRAWGGVAGGQHAGARTQSSDTRVRGAWHEVIGLDEPSAAIARIRWSIVYERVVAVRGPHVTLASSDTIAEGELRW